MHEVLGLLVAERVDGVLHLCHLWCSHILGCVFVYCLPFVEFKCGNSRFSWKLFGLSMKVPDVRTHRMRLMVLVLVSGVVVCRRVCFSNDIEMGTVLRRVEIGDVFGSVGVGEEASHIIMGKLN